MSDPARTSPVWVSEVPPVRVVDQFTGAKAPTKFFQALSDADGLCAELDELHELRTRVEELTAERDNLASDLVDLREAHEVTVRELAAVKRRLPVEDWHGHATGGLK